MNAEIARVILIPASRRSYESTLGHIGQLIDMEMSANRREVAFDGIKATMFHSLTERQVSNYGLGRHRKCRRRIWDP